MIQLLQCLRDELVRRQYARTTIASDMKMLRIEHGQGGRDREVPLSPTLLAALREYYRWMRPQTYLFPGTRHGWRADTPITPRVV